MSSYSEGYSVDLDQLEETTVTISRTVERLVTLTDDIDTEVFKKVGDSWKGLAGESAVERTTSWTTALLRAVFLVEELKLASATAHDNYSSVKSTNATMLGR